MPPLFARCWSRRRCACWAAGTGGCRVALCRRSLMFDFSFLRRTKSVFMTEERISLKGARSMWFMHHSEPGEASAPETRGLVITWAWRYDLLLWFANLVFRGKWQALRRMTADLAQLQPGEAVLDVGCGTGTLALVARQRAGATGRVCGIDPSVQMIARARRKAAPRGLSIDFQVGLIEQLAFPDQSFDVVLSTFMTHQLPHDLKRQGLAELAHVLKTRGRLLVGDTRRPEEPQR